MDAYRSSVELLIVLGYLGPDLIQFSQAACLFSLLQPDQIAVPLQQEAVAEVCLARSAVGRKPIQ